MEGLQVQSEIGPLKTVMLHRPGEELLNLIPDHLERLLFDDIPFLEVAQQEHDHFADMLREQGVEVLYLEKLCAEALDAEPGAREEYTEEWLQESGLRGTRMRAAVKEYLYSISNTQRFVEKTIAGLRKNEVALPLTANTLLTDLVNADKDNKSGLLVDPIPNAYFTRDPFAICGSGVIINHMYSVTRKRETLLAKYIFTHHPKYRRTPQWYRRDSAFRIEGGDQLILTKNSLAVGISQRTQASAIDLLAQKMFWDVPGCEIENIYAFNIPSSRAFMHLDTVFTQIDVDKFTIHPAIMGTLQVFKLSKGSEKGDVKVEEMNDTLEHVLAKILALDGVKLIPCGGGEPTAAAREQWNDASNTLCVSPGKICVYQRNSVTNELLYKEGLELLVLPSAELSRGRGGPRCMSMPFWREEL